MVFIYSGNVKMVDSIHIVQVSDNFSDLFELQVNAGDVVIICIFSE